MYVIIGANGFLGSYYIKNILEKTDENILAVARNVPEREETERIFWASCDITDAESVRKLNRDYISKSDDNKIIYLAAYHHPDLVEKNPRTAWDVNITALSRFLNIADNVKCFFYPSSDSVYGESVNGKVFSEEDELRPLNLYGMNKCVAERLVTGYGYNVIRYPFLIGPSLLSSKKHFYDFIVENILNGKPVDMFTDSYRSAISFDLAAATLICLIERHIKDIPQILNICGDDALSKFEIGVMIADKYNVSRNMIRPISIHDNSGVFEAKRASSTLMSNEKLKNILGVSEIKLSWKQ